MLVDAAGVFIMKQFFESIPVSVEEAARIDGAGIVPHLLVGGAADGATGADHADHPGVPELVERVPAHAGRRAETRSCSRCRAGSPTWSAARSGAGTQYPLKLGAALLATIPVAIVFVVFQRYFVRGATEGAEKG